MIRSDMRNKEIALGRIKRLSSSSLPLESPNWWHGTQPEGPTVSSPFRDGTRV